MPPSPTRSGLAAARAAGPNGLALAAIIVLVGPVLGRLLPATAAVVLVLVQGVVSALGGVALVHVLAASRPEPAPSIWPPDRSARVAVRRAAALRYSLVRIALLELLVVLGATILVLPLAGDLLQDEKLSTREQFEIGLPINLVAVLLAAFVALVPQRLALVGDPRVMAAVVHSVTISRTAYAAMFGLVMLQTMPTLAASAALAYDAAWAWVPLLLVAAPVQVLVVAWLTEVFLAGPSIEPPESRPGDGLDE